MIEKRPRIDELKIAGQVAADLLPSSGLAPQFMLCSVLGRNVSDVWWKETVTRRPSGWPGDCGAGLQNAFPKTPSGSRYPYTHGIGLMCA